MRSPLVRGEDDRRLARDAPNPLGIERHDAGAAVARRLARPQEPPGVALDRCQQRLGRGVEHDVAAEIDDQQPVARRSASKKRSIQASSASAAPSIRPGRCPSTGSVAPQRKKIAMQRIDRGVSLPFADDRAPIGGRCRCRRDRSSAACISLAREAGELREKACRARRGRRAPARSRDRRNRRTGSTRRIPAPGTASECPASAGNKRSSREGGRGSSARGSAARCRNWRSGRGSAERRQSIPPARSRLGRAARFLLPLVALPLIEEAVLGGGDELARPAAIIGVIGLVVSGQRDHGAVMEIVVPQGVEPVAAVLGRPHQPRLLRLVLADDKGGAARVRPRAPAGRWRRGYGLPI